MYVNHSSQHMIYYKQIAAKLMNKAIRINLFKGRRDAVAQRVSIRALVVDSIPTRRN